MYSKKAWGGNIDSSFILVTFPKVEVEDGGDPAAALLIYEFRDQKFIGVPDPQSERNVSASLALALKLR